MSQFAPRGELETFWTNLFLRGRMLFDPVGIIASVDYGQPETGLPASRAFVIGPDGSVVLPLFGHDPQRMIDAIHGLLETMPVPGDFDGDRDVDASDLDAFDSCFTGPGGGPIGASCEPGDFDGDQDIDCADRTHLAHFWSDPDPFPIRPACYRDPVEMRLEARPGGTVACWTDLQGAGPHDVVRGRVPDLTSSASTVDLGVLVCIEAASLDNCTLGHEDGAVPPGGEAWFYLVGQAPGAGLRYGMGSEESPRVAGTEGCP